MIGLIRLRLLVDKSLLGGTAQIRMERALERQRALVLEATDGRLGTEWEIIPYVYKMMDIPWTQTTVNGKVLFIPAAHYVQEMTHTHRGDASFLQMVIDQDNWKPSLGTIGGLNMFETQVLKVHPAWGVYGWFITFEMELLHSFDQIIANRLGVDISKRFDVRSYDMGVVHGEDPRYTVYKYGHVYKELQNELIEIYPNETIMVDEEKLNQITNELLFRNPIAGEEVYLGRPEEDVRAEVGALKERMKLIYLVSSARKITPL